MQRHPQGSTPARRAAIGFAADGQGYGLVYARFDDAAEQLLRIPFRVQRYPGLEEREVGYAALTAVLEHLRKRGAGRVTFEIEDARLVRDLTDRGELPAALVLPYVRLGCELNRFDAFAVEAGPGGVDLTARARAEVTMHVAA